jgi:hypothetical protein
MKQDQLDRRLRMSQHDRMPRYVRDLLNEFPQAVVVGVLKACGPHAGLVYLRQECHAVMAIIQEIRLENERKALDLQDP